MRGVAVEEAFCHRPSQRIGVCHSPPSLAENALPPGHSGDPRAPVYSPRHWTGAPLFLRARSVILRPHTCNLSHRRAHRSRLCRVQNGLLGLAPLLHCRNKLRPISAPTRHRSEETRGFFTLTNSRIHRLVCLTRIWPTACPLSLINVGEWNWKAEGFLPSVRVQG